jgi:hypothetical protein
MGVNSEKSRKNGGDTVSSRTAQTVWTTSGQALSCNMMTLLVSMLGHFLLTVAERCQRFPQYCCTLMMSGSSLKCKRTADSGQIRMSRLRTSSGYSCSLGSCLHRWSISHCVSVHGKYFKEFRLHCPKQSPCGFRSNNTFTRTMLAIQIWLCEPHEKCRKMNKNSISCWFSMYKLHIVGPTEKLTKFS